MCILLSARQITIGCDMVPVRRRRGGPQAITMLADDSAVRSVLLENGALRDSLPDAIAHGHGESD